MACALVLIAVLTPARAEPHPKEPLVVAAPSVWVQGRDPLTNARVKKVLPDGILFICDQGLVKARFDQLGPEWAVEYGDDAQRAAAKDLAVKKETLAILQARDRDSREAEWFSGNFVSKRDGMALLDCGYEGKASAYQTTANEQGKRRVYGMVAVKDDGTFFTAQVRNYFEIVGRRSDDVKLESGEAIPCYTIISVEASHQ